MVSVFRVLLPATGNPCIFHATPECVQTTPNSRAELSQMASSPRRLLWESFSWSMMERQMNPSPFPQFARNPHAQPSPVRLLWSPEIGRAASPTLGALIFVEHALN